VIRNAAEASPVSEATWRQRVQRALLRLVMAADAHIGESEGPGGLLDEVESKAPRLWREVEKMRSEHGELLEDCFRILEEVRGTTASLCLIRNDVLTLVDRFEYHRHRGADLVYEAYGVDIGGG